MNILFYLHRFPGYGGIETVTATLANAFVARGFGVTILSHIAESDDCVSLALDPAVRVEHMPVGPVCASSHYRSFFEDVVVRQRITHIVFQDSYSPIEHNLDGVWDQIPVIVCEHNMPYSFRSIKLSPIRRLLHMVRHPVASRDPYWADNVRKRYIYDRCCRYLLLSKYYYGEFRALAKLFDSRKLRVMPNPLTTPQAILNQSAEWSQKENLAIFAGTLSTAKGATRALNAWKIICEQKGVADDWRLVILGDGEEMPSCREVIEKYSLKNVSLEGYQPDVFKFLRRAKLYLHPSSRDGFPMTLVEAMSCGCVPIVFDSFGAVNDIVEDGVNGLLVSPYDIGAFAAACTYAMRSDGALMEMSHSARSIIAKFSVEKVISRWEMILNNSGGNCEC